MRRALPLCLLLLSAACPWRGYEDILRVHLDVLAGIADKAAAGIAAGRRPSANDVTELTYPLQRARQFARQFDGEAGRASYRAFTEALDSYNRFVEAVDAARVDPGRWAAARPRLGALHAELDAALAATRRALEPGG